jgi:uncharacterized tellurite resistance protein B-like protein
MVKRSAGKRTIETEELRALNEDMGKYLENCKSEVKEHQKFLSFTNDMLRELKKDDQKSTLSTEQPLKSKWREKPRQLENKMIEN